MTTKLKTFSSAFLLAVMALTGCSGSGLTNEKEVDKTAFLAAAVKTLKTNTYNRCDQKGKIIETETGKKEEETIESTFQYTTSGMWTLLEEKGEYLEITHVSVEFTSLASRFALLGLKDTLTCYTADNGFRMTFNSYSSIEKNNSKVETEFRGEYIYNEFGYPTKITGFSKISNGNEYEQEEVSIEFKYYSVN